MAMPLPPEQPFVVIVPFRNAVPSPTASNNPPPVKPLIARSCSPAREQKLYLEELTGNITSRSWRSGCMASRIDRPADTDALRGDVEPDSVHAPSEVDRTVEHRGLGARRFGSASSPGEPLLELEVFARGQSVRMAVVAKRDRVRERNVPIPGIGGERGGRAVVLNDGLAEGMIALAEDARGFTPAVRRR